MNQLPIRPPGSISRSITNDLSRTQDRSLIHLRPGYRRSASNTSRSAQLPSSTGLSRCFINSRSISSKQGPAPLQDRRSRCSLTISRPGPRVPKDTGKRISLPFGRKKSGTHPGRQYPGISFCLAGCKTGEYPINHPAVWANATTQLQGCNRLLPYFIKNSSRTNSGRSKGSLHLVEEIVDIKGF